MPQGILPFKYEKEKTETGMTSLAGLPIYLDLAHVAGLWKSIEKHLHVRTNSQGYTDSQTVMSIALMNLAAGDCMDDLAVIEADTGFCQLLQKAQMFSLPRKDRRKQERRWRKQQQRTVPSPSAGFRYLEAFHDEKQEKLRQPGKAFIPTPNQHLKGFPKVNGDLLGFAQNHKPCKFATLDMDATLIQTNKAEAFYCYKGFKAYQPLNTWWAQQEMIVHTDFRDGNVPAGYEQLRVLQESLSILPKGIQKVRLRSDTAGYQHDLLRYCAMGENKRFGVIDFAVGCDVSVAFKQAVSKVVEDDWHPIYKVRRNGTRYKSGQEWAEVCFVPNKIGHSKKGPEYRYLAIREVLSSGQLSLFEEDKQQQLPFQTLSMQNLGYKIFGMATNMDWHGETLIHWQRDRCGKSEQAHSIMKEDLAGGKLPSGKFGENAAWWWIMILSLNLNQAMKQLVLDRKWRPKRLKAIRFSLINIAGRVMERSHQLFIRISKNHPCFDWLIELRTRIAGLKPQPSG